jgi:hypothetical protein
MSQDKHTDQAAPASGSPASGGGGDDAELAKKETAARVEQDSRVAEVRREAKESSKGSAEPASDLNRDG